MNKRFTEKLMRHQIFSGVAAFPWGKRFIIAFYLYLIGPPQRITRAWCRREQYTPILVANHRWCKNGRYQRQQRLC